MSYREEGLREELLWNLSSIRFYAFLTREATEVLTVAVVWFGIVFVFDGKASSVPFSVAVSTAAICLQKRQARHEPTTPNKTQYHTRPTPHLPTAPALALKKYAPKLCGRSYDAKRFTMTTLFDSRTKS
ncbi:hypothetical protein BG842_07995 [Haladaptatus sp. W1]|nr:hypothetical protein BG842_07995 [Haladaptatus sp. W1]